MGQQGHPQIEPKNLTLVRITAPHFVAGLETDGVVRRAAPILAYMVGWSDEDVRVHVRQAGWKASVIPTHREIIQHQESFEVRHPGGRKFFYFDDNDSRRAVTGRMTSKQAFAAAQTFLRGIP